MTTPSFGSYGEQGDFATDGQFEDALNSSGVADALGTGQPAGGDDDTSPIPGGGPLLEQADPKKLFKAVDSTVLRQDRLARNREEKRKHHMRVRGNIAFAFLEKSEDRSIVRATLPPGIEDIGAQPVPNKMDDLCNKIVSQVLTDDFLPNPKPDGDADRDRGAADLGKKFLRADGTATGTDDKQLGRDVLNMNLTDASAFTFCWVDLTGGGWRPKQINAHPRAEDAAKPLYAPRLDPQSGIPVMTATGAIMEKATSPILRYVAEVPNPEDPTAPPSLVFTENAAEAARQWLPKHCRRILTCNQVRTVPQSATVFTAPTIILIMYDSLGEAKKRFKILRTMKDEELAKVCQWRPKRWKTAVVQEAHRPKDDGEGVTKVTDDTLICWYEHLCRIGPEYQDGAQIAVNGANGGFVLLRETLREDVELEDGTTAPVLMDPPVSQFIACTDIEDGDPFGMAPISRFGGSKEAWDHIWIGFFDAMHKALNRNSYIPGTSTVTREDINRRDGTPIDILTAADKPTFEDPPQIPSFAPDMLDKLEIAINSAAGTNETSNGLDSRYSDSGVAKDISIKQARTALAQYWQGYVKGLCHYWHVKIQLAQARLTVPQLVKLSGAESAYKQPWFVGSDLFGVSQVALEPGTGTMMTPTEKAQHLALLQGQEWIDKETASEIARASMTDDLGLPPNVHEEAIDRELAAWSRGPSPEWVKLQAENDKATQQYQAATSQQVAVLAQQGVDPQAAQQQVQQTMPAPQLPVLPSPFEDRPNIDDPTVALIRYRKLSRMASSVEYTKQPKPWRTLLDQRLVQARQAAGIATMAEQQQAAQQQAQTAAADEQYQGFLQLIDKSARHRVEAVIAKGVQGDAMGGGGGGDDTAKEDPSAERDFKAGEAQKDRDTKLEIAARQHMSRDGAAPARARPARATA